MQIQIDNHIIDWSIKIKGLDDALWVYYDEFLDMKFIKYI